MILSSPTGPSRVRTAAVGLVAAAVLLGLALIAASVGDRSRSVLLDVVELVVAIAAGLGCLRAARRTHDVMRRGWTAMAVACWSWAAGQGMWITYENVLGIRAPYDVSAADLGYLGFPVAALLGLVWLAPPESGLATRRRLLDALMVGCSLAVLAWLTVLDTVIANSVGPPLADAVSLAYPLADLVLLTVAVLTVAQTRDEPLLWGLLGAGVLAMAVADAVYVYQGAQGIYRGGTLLELGWCSAFILLGAAGSRVTEDRPAPDERPTSRTAVRAGLLPYLPLAAAALMSTAKSLSGQEPDLVTVALLVLVVAFALARQYLTVRENQELAAALKQREVQLHHLAFHDGLTGLANRALFLDRLGHALELARRNGRPVSVAFLDLDGFKAVNDALGHAVGDALLVRVAERLRGALRAADTLARLGGDEFAVLVEQGDDPTALAQGMIAALEAPFHFDGRTVAVSASVGVATVQADSAGAAQAASLLHRADVAMYAAKASGKGHVQVHSPAMEVAARRHEAPVLRRAFVAALESGDILPVYHPLADPVTGRITALEAKPHWTHEGLQVPPGTFLPICAQAGLGEQLTTAMLEQACAALDGWSQQLGHRQLRVAVNVGPAEYSDPAFPDRIAALIDRYRLAPQQLDLEMTEIAQGNRPENATEIMQRLRALGVRLALDDFGTGYNTLAQLSNTPVDTVKVDRYFVSAIDHDTHRRNFLAGLLELARNLGMGTVVEGVERPGQLRELRLLGCDLVQGNLVGRPGKAAETAALVLADRPLLAPDLLGPLVPQA
jgi:diguanylate cyclase (GGDEF)-like protein